MKQPDSDLKLLSAAMREAGHLALNVRQRGFRSWRKADGSQVSEADIAVNELLAARLRGARPDYGWLSEESPDGVERLSAARVWIVDPIDGTAAFLSGKSDWCLSAALVEAGEPIAAVVFNAARDEFFSAARGEGASLSGVRLKVSNAGKIEGSRLIAPLSVLKPKFWSDPLPPCEAVWANSLAYRLCLVASARADASIALSPKWEWDLAAGVLIAAEAGAEVTSADGAKLAFNKPTPRIEGMLVAPPVLHASLLQRRKAPVQPMPAHPAREITP